MTTADPSSRAAGPARTPRSLRRGAVRDQRVARTSTPSDAAGAVRARPAWARPGLLLLLVATAALYLWGLSASGWGNAFYAAAAQAGSRSWEALFYGSSDAANSITVDKPPAFLWVMGISVRLFGLHSWSLLAPQALEGVASVALLHASVRRVAGDGAALLAGAVLALTPVAALMFRFDNPDALLVLLMVAAAWTTTRAVADGRWRWVLATGALLGLGFLTKQLQVLLALPPIAGAYLLAGPPRLGRRVVHLLAAAGAMVVSAGWWIAVVELVPASDRPFIGGSQSNDFLQLTFGYNGFGRLSGDEVGSVGGGGFGATSRGFGRGGSWGSTGLGRLFSPEVGSQVAWLLPAALVLLLAGLWVLRRAPRTDPARAALVLWGGWVVVTGVVFSEMAGIFHPYYTVALAPGIAGAVGIGAALLWRVRQHWVGAAVLAATAVGTSVWAAVLLDRAASWNAWLRPSVVVLGVLAALALLAAPLLEHRAAAQDRSSEQPASQPVSQPVGASRHRWTAAAGAVAATGAGLAVVAALAAPAAYAVQTASTGHTGSIPSAGPAQTAGFGRGGARAGFARGGFGAGAGRQQGSTRRFGGFAGGTAGAPGGGRQGQVPGQTRRFGAGTGAGTGGGTGGGFRGGFGGGGGGGLLDATTPSAALTAALRADASSYTWVAAAIGSNNASGYQLATQDPVMPIGGFNGTDPSPTLAEFQADVAAGRIHYFIASGIGGRAAGGSSDASAITSWVEQRFSSRSVGGATLYDLSAGASSTST